MSEVASAFVTLVPSFKGGQAAISREMDGPMVAAGRTSGRKAGGAMSKGIGGIVGGAATKIFAPLAAAAGGVAIFGFLKGAVSEASGLAEAGNKVNAIFGKDGAKAVGEFAKGASKSIGQSELQAINGAANFGIFGKSAGLAGKDLTKFSTGFSTLASDMASFYDASPEEVIAAIGSGLRGEAEPLRKYGVLMNDASLKAEAMKLGLIKTTKEALTPQQKVLAAQALIYAQTGDAQGDFAKTSDSLANQQRILGASFDDIKGKIGSAFLPMLNRLAKWFIDDGLPAVERFGRWLRDDLWPAMQTGYDTIMPGVREALDILGGAFGGGEGSAKDFGKVITDKIIPALATFFRVYLPAAATQLRILIEGVKIAWRAFLTWRNYMLTVASTILGAFIGITRGFATMLRGLSKVPGFGWAKDAADKMDNAADKASDLKRGIDNIKDKKVTVKVTFTSAGKVNLGNGVSVDVGQYKARERGGPVAAGETYVVGEKRPELFVPKTDGYIMPTVPSNYSGSAGGSGGSGNVFHLYDSDGALMGTMRGAAKAEVTSAARGILRGTR